MNKEEIVVSAEVKTFLCDLYSQIEYELQEQYKDEVQKLQAKVNQLEMSIATKDSELLQLKDELRQLKSNRDEAIEYIKHWEDIWYSNSQQKDKENLAELLSLLERGKE